MSSRPSLIVFVFLALLRSGTEGAEPSRAARESPSQYCGLHCVHAAAQVLGRPFSFEQIVETKYLTAARGSTAEDLCTAIRNVGLYPSAHGHFTVDHLRLVDRPVILHVRSPGQTMADHWLLFLGWEKNGKIRIYDPPREAGDADIGELLSLWDGVAIVVSASEPGVLDALFSIPCSLTSLTFVIGAVLALRIASKRVAGSRLVLGLTVVMGLAAQLVLPSSFWRSPSAVANVQAAFFETRVPHINLDRLNRLVDSSNCYLVDARFPNAYDRDHLPNAVNVPVDAGYLRLRHAIAAMGRPDNVVVYCQSESCGWADVVAGQLSARGVRNVRVYEGGVNEWRGKGGDQ
ncbi:MAG TPA: rhodanese-like domain-containing protein [Pirellulales bacterium]|nr:rhodanese-like domain-containing protein [Pirellulales bacterium]